MDTDSFIIEVINQNIILKNKDQFDTSNFCQDSELYNNQNKNKPGTIKDEYAENRIREHIELKPKSYSIIVENNNENCIHKVYTANFTRDKHRDILNNTKILTHQMNQIVFLDHVLFTKKINKQS